VNPFLLDLLDYPFESIIGLQLWEIGLFEDIAANQAAFEKLQTEKYIRYENHPLRTKAGCDLLTISPELMKQLSKSHEPVERKLTPEKAKRADVKRLDRLDERKFRYLVNEDAMATEKTAEGIRKFAADIGKLERFVAHKIN
jgi:transaldolase